MDAVMYGLIPSANSVAFENAEPVKILRYANIEPPVASMDELRAAEFT